jgi:RNA polymerase sigma factor (sigma-70 family)
MSMSEFQPPGGPPTAARADPVTSDPDLHSTRALLRRASEGDSSALEALAARYMPALRRFAHGRLPPRARSVFDTDDLVQVSIVRAMSRLQEFEVRHSGSLLAYLRQIVLNRVRDEVRRTLRSPERGEMPEELPDPHSNPAEAALGRETLALYEKALAEMPSDCQEAIMLRVEMGCSYAEIAAALGRPSPNAARLHTARALLRLAEKMRPLRDER